MHGKPLQNHVLRGQHDGLLVLLARGKFNKSVHPGRNGPLHPAAGPHTPMTSCAQATFPHSISPTPQGRRSNVVSDPQHGV